MSTIDSENISKPGKKAPQAKKTAGKPKSDGTNKKAEVIAMMKRAKGVMLAEIQKLTGWQKHTLRGFISLLGSKAGLNIISVRSGAGEPEPYRICSGLGSVACFESLSLYPSVRNSLLIVAPTKIFLRSQVNPEARCFR